MSSVEVLPEEERTPIKLSFVKGSVFVRQPSVAEVREIEKTFPHYTAAAGPAKAGHDSARPEGRLRRRVDLPAHVLMLTGSRCGRTVRPWRPFRRAGGTKHGLRCFPAFTGIRGVKTRSSAAFGKRLRPTWLTGLCERPRRRTCSTPCGPMWRTPEKTSQPARADDSCAGHAVRGEGRRPSAVRVGPGHERANLSTLAEVRGRGRPPLTRRPPSSSSLRRWRRRCLRRRVPR
jgi:hypothetical protein